MSSQHSEYIHFRCSLLLICSLVSRSAFAWCSLHHVVTQALYFNHVRPPKLSWNIYIFYNIILSVNVYICMSTLTITYISIGNAWASSLGHLPLARIPIGRCWVNHVPNLRHLQWSFQTSITSWDHLSISCHLFWVWSDSHDPHWQVLDETCPQPWAPPVAFPVPTKIILPYTQAFFPLVSLHINLINDTPAMAI